MAYWTCIQVGHHDEVGQAITEMEKQDWSLHTYSTAGFGEGLSARVNH